jgi:hypothetical protein
MDISRWRQPPEGRKKYCAPVGVRENDSHAIDTPLTPLPRRVQHQGPGSGYCRSVPRRRGALCESGVFPMGA